MEELHEAMFYSPQKNKEVVCYLCYRLCRIKPGEWGYCRIRQNIGGKLYAQTYGKAYFPAIDPIEKKPFYHFMPGTKTFSFCTVGCNFRCMHCCNSELSQSGPGQVPETPLPPEDIVGLAKQYGTQGISYTYTEPTVFYEYAHDTGVLARKEGLYNAFVTNGYATPMPVRKSVDFLDAARIDLKGEEEHYRRVCGDVVLDYVLDCIREYYKTGMHIELITLVIPGDNDNKGFVERMAGFIKGMSSEIPWHFIRFYPTYKMLDVPQTEVKTLEHMVGWAKDAGIRYPYIGNVEGHPLNNTYCHNCGELLIKRPALGMTEVLLSKGNKCPACSTKIPIVTEIKR